MAAGGTGESWSAYQQGEAQSARTFTLVGVVFYIIGAVVGGIVIVSTLLAFAFFSMMTPMGFGLFFPIIFAGVFVAIAAGLAAWSWMTLQQIEAGRYQEAQAPTLILGILGLFFAFIVGGIFLILAYVKLGNVTSPRPAPPAMAAAAPVAGRVCPNCGRPVPMDAKFCNHCGRELPE